MLDVCYSPDDFQRQDVYRAATTNSKAYRITVGLIVAVRKMCVVMTCMLHRQLSHITVSHLAFAVTKAYTA